MPDDQVAKLQEVVGKVPAWDRNTAGKRSPSAAGSDLRSAKPLISRELGRVGIVAERRHSEP